VDSSLSSHSKALRVTPDARHRLTNGGRREGEKSRGFFTLQPFQSPSSYAGRSTSTVTRGTRRPVYANGGEGDGRRSRHNSRDLAPAEADIDCDEGGKREESRDAGDVKTRLRESLGCGKTGGEGDDRRSIASAATWRGHARHRL
jgi:hypothetical protein